jgi:hypothetical protein
LAGRARAVSTVSTVSTVSSHRRTDLDSAVASGCIMLPFTSRPCAELHSLLRFAAYRVSRYAISQLLESSACCEFDARSHDMTVNSMALFHSLHSSLDLSSSNVLSVTFLNLSRRTTTTQHSLLKGPISKGNVRYSSPSVHYNPTSRIAVPIVPYLRLKQELCVREQTT